MLGLQQLLREILTGTSSGIVSILNILFHGTFTDVVKLLNQFEIYSIYHMLTKVKFGTETEPTLYFRKNRKTPYHIDYIFAPIGLINSRKPVSVGKYEDWIPLSDHMPLIAEIE